MATAFEQKLNRAHSRYTRLGVVRPCEKTSAQKCNTLMSNDLMKPSLFHPLPSTPEWFYACVCVFRAQPLLQDPRCAGGDGRGLPRAHCDCLRVAWVGA